MSEMILFFIINMKGKKNGRKNCLFWIGNWGQAPQIHIFFFYFCFTFCEFVKLDPRNPTKKTALFAQAIPNGIFKHKNNKPKD